MGQSTLAEIIRTLRKAHGWKQQELARRAGLVQGAITNIETGRTPNPTVATIQALAQAFGVTTDDLLSGRAAGPEYQEAPPLAELEALGYGADKIERVVRSWAAWSPATRRALLVRARSLASQQTQIQAMRAEIAELEALLNGEGIVGNAEDHAVNSGAHIVNGFH